MSWETPTINNVTLPFVKVNTASMFDQKKWKVEVKETKLLLVIFIKGKVLCGL